MPAFVLLLMALFAAALAASVCFLLALALQKLSAGQLQHLPADYLMRVVVFTLETAVAHALLLGMPLFLGLYRLKWLKWWSCTLAGLLIAAIPIAIRSWPLRHAAPNVSAMVMRGGKMVQTMVNGVPTLAGWLDYGWGILTYAALGALGGLSFWLIWRRLAPVLERLPARR
jgi:hypothetical protein